jgi:hypothetical protein
MTISSDEQLQLNAIVSLFETAGIGTADTSQLNGRQLEDTMTPTSFDNRTYLPIVNGQVFVESNMSAGQRILTGMLKLKEMISEATVS